MEYAQLKFLHKPRIVDTGEIYMETWKTFLYTSNWLFRKQMKKKKMRRIKENLNPILAMELTFQTTGGHRLFQSWM